MGELKRGERLQIMLTEEEVGAVDDWRFTARMPSRAAAIRELLKRGLAAEGFALADSNAKSGDYGVTVKSSSEAVADRQKDPADRRAGRAANSRRAPLSGPVVIPDADQAE